jgi:flagellar basal-body rod modification protein FlgD
MSRIPTTFPQTSSTTTKSNSNSVPDAVNDLDLSTFLNLMISELQHQDPLNPMDNKDMLAQISQLREVGATDKLTQTLESVLLGQNIASATNLIGADVSALSDEGENVEGIVKRVSIADGSPKLHVDRDTEIGPTGGEGNIEAGEYSYRVVWENAQGKLAGIEFTGDDAVTTTGAKGVDQAIQLSNLPFTSGPKLIYRSDGEGHEPYQLVGTITDGKQASFTDRLSDKERRSDQLGSNQFERSASRSRSYEVSLNNVSAIRPPGD